MPTGATMPMIGPRVRRRVRWTVATSHPEGLVPVHLGRAFGLARLERARVRPAVVAHAHAGPDCITRNGVSAAGSTLLTIRSREDRGT